MSRVELIYDDDCPNVERARRVLRRALEAAGLAPRWQEWDRADPRAPDYVREQGSPTILVDGEDAAGAEPGGGDCCRVYSDAEGGGLGGVPPVGTIVRALERAKAERSGGRSVVDALVVPPAPREDDKWRWIFSTEQTRV